MSHEHCDRCYRGDCRNHASCPMINCRHGCSARMHECKRDDHDHVCPKYFIPCLNAIYGCPLTIQRSLIAQHLSECAASVVVCTYLHSPKYQMDDLKQSADTHEDDATNLLPSIARRDQIWYDYFEEFREKQRNQAKLEESMVKKPIVEHVIRSIRYPYITIPECVLSKNDGVICSTCRLRLRQLEENEDQRLAEAPEEVRTMIENFSMNPPSNSLPNTSPSLVQMSYTSINASDLPMTTASVSAETTTEPSPRSDVFLSVQSESEFATSYIHRLNYFSSQSSNSFNGIFSENPQFPCLTCCRRDEIERHFKIHETIHCVLGTSLLEQCPKSQYGCTVRWQRLEPIQNTGEPIRIRFDQRNDAVAFEWYPSLNAVENQRKFLLDLPTELLREILLHLDSLSLRNVSLVCRKLRDLCQDLLPIRGIVLNEYERHMLSYGDITWLERSKHWLFTNTTSAVPKWQLTDRTKATAWNKHISQCPYGEIKDLENEKPYRLVAWAPPEPATESESTDLNSSQ